MRAVIVGAGAVGRPIAERLSNRGEKIIVVDKSVKVARALSGKIDAAIFVGDGGSKEILDEAETKKADVLLAFTDDDKANARITRLAKQRYGVPFVLALSNSPKQADNLIGAGADQVVCPEEEVLSLIENIVIKGGVSSIFQDRMTNCSLYRIDLLADSPVIGKRVSELRMPGLSRICAFIRRKRFLPVESDLELQLGDQLYVIGPSKDVEMSEGLFAG
jgi:trk system potassium uptake protein TrkA